MNSSGSSNNEAHCMQNIKFLLGAKGSYPLSGRMSCLAPRPPTDGSSPGLALSLEERKPSFSYSHTRYLCSFPSQRRLGQLEPRPG